MLIYLFPSLCNEISHGRSFPDESIKISRWQWRSHIDDCGTVGADTKILEFNINYQFFIYNVP
jgi:hypothetical protein